MSRFIVSSGGIYVCSSANDLFADCCFAVFRLHRPCVAFYNYRFVIASFIRRRLAACILPADFVARVALLHLTLATTFCLLIDIARWQSPGSHSSVDDFLLQRKGDPFLRRIGIGPQTAQLLENFLFVLCHPLTLK
jgi:hypothetical protein